LRTYSWDAANRLIGVSLTARPGEETAFKYDGVGRRIAIKTITPAVTSETRYLWCGQMLCQARNPADVPTRRYFAEGEEIPGGALLYYAKDQLGSVRDVLEPGSGNPVASLDYEPYGFPTQSSGQVPPDFRYAGLFYHQQSGLYLATYRVYEPRIGRWLSRDPLGEGFAHNLYEYVDGNPVNDIDPGGLISWAGTPAWCRRILRTMLNLERSIRRRVNDLKTDPSGGTMPETCEGDWLKTGLKY
jgi:RHS repeat-associated protein